MTPRARTRPPAPDPDGRIRTIRAPLLRWYRRHRRQLPWRETRDPYAIWVSEIMLQQTQVVTVIPYWERFLERFPDPTSLAAAAEDDVLGMWSGLGYYRRARALQAGAREVVARHDGRLPDDADALLALPGIGRYTAGAIASIAYDRPEPILDGNVRRVLSRLLAFDASALTRGGEDRALWDVAAALVRGSTPGDLNQGLMELGALVCTPRTPSCSDCPIREHCAAHHEDRVEAYPVPRAKPTVTNVAVAAAWVVSDDRVLVVPREPDAPLRGRFDVPAVECNDVAGLLDELSGHHGLTVGDAVPVGHVRHGIMNRRLRIDVFAVTLRHPDVPQASRWIPRAELPRAPVSGATQKIARHVESAAATPSLPFAASRSSRSLRSSRPGRPRTAE